jgi:hypothetical protein
LVFSEVPRIASWIVAAGTCRSAIGKRPYSRLSGSAKGISLAIVTP